MGGYDQNLATPDGDVLSRFADKGPARPELALMQNCDKIGKRDQQFRGGRIYGGLRRGQWAGSSLRIWRNSYLASAILDTAQVLLR